jgi:hypothetical protein
MRTNKQARRLGSHCGCEGEERRAEHSLAGHPNTRRLGVQGAQFREQGKGTDAKGFVHGRENGTSPYSDPFASRARKMQSLHTPVVSPPAKAPREARRSTV